MSIDSIRAWADNNALSLLIKNSLKAWDQPRNEYLSREMRYFGANRMLHCRRFAPALGLRRRRGRLYSAFPCPGLQFRIQPHVRLYLRWWFHDHFAIGYLHQRFLFRDFSATDRATPKVLAFRPPIFP